MTLPQLDQQQPENRFDTIPSYYAVGFTPALADGFFVQWFRQQFAFSDNLAHMVLRNASGPAADFVWRDGAETGIVIETVDVWKRQTVEGRPAILIRRNDWTWERIGIGDIFMGSHTEDAHDRFGVFMVGSHTFFCMSREPEEAAIIAEEAYQGILQSQQEIRKTLCMHRFVLASVGTIGQLKESADTFVIPITVAYAQEMTQTVRLESPVFKRLQMNNGND